MFHAEITISVCNLADYIMHTAHMFVDEIPSVLPEKKTISDTVVHTLYILESQFSTCLMVKSNILPSLNHHQ